MSAENEDFEILETEPNNDEQKDTDSDIDQDIIEEHINDLNTSIDNLNINETEIIIPNLISSNALFTNSEPVSIATSSNASQILHSPIHSQNLSQNEHKSEQMSPLAQSIDSHSHSDSESEDMNLEQTPPIPNNAVIQSAVMVNHEINDQNFSEIKNHKHINDDHKDKEQSPMPVGREGSAPIVSNISTPNNGNESPKVYDNPYYNGSQSTPGQQQQRGEESDEESEHLLPQKLTVNNDSESDEEKDIHMPQHKNDKENAANEENVIQHKSNRYLYVSISVVLLAVIIAVCVLNMEVIHTFGIFLLDFTKYFTKNHSGLIFKPEPPKFHCPPSVIYVPMDGNQFYINASHFDHPLRTKYEWDITNMDELNDFFIDGEQTNSLLLMKGDGGPVQINLELYISYTIDNAYMFNKQCSLSVLFHESPFFGIDLGTTYSCIAYQERQTKQRETKIIVADKHRQEYCIPTAVYFPPHTESVIVGEDALKKLAIDPLNVIFDIKRIVGRHCDDSEIEFFQNLHQFNVTCGDKNDSPQIFVPNLNAFIMPEQALSVILGHLVEIASAEFGVPYIRDVVVSIPALFHNGQRKAIYSSCELVGLNVKQLVVEPTAAALAYSYYSSTPADNFKLFLTFDFGGGTIDCSVLRCTGVDCQVIGVRGNSSLGGIDFDYIIRDIMIEKYETQHGWDNIRSSEKLSAKFLKVAERVKKSLSVSTQHQVTMTNDELMHAKPEKKQILITRTEFEENKRTIALINSAINTAKLAINTDRIRASNIRMILMIGGTTKVPLIQQRLAEEFGVINGLKLVFPSDDPQLMVVKGSAIIGASLQSNTKDLKNIVLEDVIPLSLGFSICLTNYNKSIGDTKCGIMDVIIEKNSHYPTRAKVVYCQKDPNSNVAKLDLFEGESEFVSDNYLLSHLSISDIPKRSEGECDSIIVEFIIDKNGIAEIEAIVNDKNKKNKKETSFTNTLSVVSSDGSLSESDIKVLKHDMIQWFSGHKSIQNALVN